jgi:hypothetical protein
VARKTREPYYTPGLPAISTGLAAESRSDHQAVLIEM